MIIILWSIYTYSAPGDYHNTTLQLRFITNGRKCTNIPIVNDDIPEREERFLVTLSSSNPRVRFSSFRRFRTTTIRIMDDDGKLFCM